jgi:pimeloyl-ACP methyl ester carboxylesterase
MLWVVLLGAFACTSLHGQEIAEAWQGTLGAGPGIRVVLKISKGSDGSLGANLYILDQDPHRIPVTSITVRGGILTLTVDSIHGRYEGKLSADGASIIGTLTQGETTPLDFQRTTRETAWPTDPTPHRVQFVAVDKDVKLEVLDWGGSGRPLILLAGLGNTAHVFDKFAQKLTPSYHVYGITRRGFGESSVPVPGNGNYSADRLGDDVLAVIDALKIDRPILVGHSIAGEELSSIGSRHPEKVAGLIYLEAGYGYAFYDRTHGDLGIDTRELIRRLEVLDSAHGPREMRAIAQQLIDSDLPRIESDLKEALKFTQGLTGPLPALPAAQLPAAAPDARQAILEGEQKYTDIHSPVLAIFGLPHDMGTAFQNDPSARAVLEAYNKASTAAQADAIEAGIPGAQVVRIPNADHNIFVSNEADVLRTMNAFIARLP